MEDQDIEETTDADETLATSPYSLPENYSEESRNSDDYYRYNNGTPINEMFYDGWGSDAFYHESADEDTKSEACEFITFNTSENRIIENSENVQSAEEIIEENNNDPNNNMDSIQLNEMEAIAGCSHDFAAERSPKNVLNVDDVHNPKPGCSKDSYPVFLSLFPYTSTSESTKLEKTKQILRVVSKINHDSIFDALSKDNKIPIKMLKLWDLIPEQERRQYSEQNDIKNISVEECEKVSNSVENNRMQMEWTVTNNVAKRGPADDICTIKPKKSSSDPDLSINAPATSSDFLPRVTSTSEIMNLPEKFINRGAIPKIRKETIEKIPDTEIKAQKNLISEAENAIPMEEIPVLETLQSMICMQEKNSKPEKKLRINKEANVVQTTTTVNNISAPSNLIIKAPILKYPATKSVASKSKSQPESVNPSANRINQQKSKESGNRLAKSAPQRVPVTSIEAPKPIATGLSTMYQVNRQTQMKMGNDNQKQMVPVMDRQHNQRVMINRPKQMAPLAAATINQRKQTQTINRAQQSPSTTAPIATAMINQQRQTQTINRAQQLQLTTAPIAAATINQQRQTQMMYRAQQPQPTTAPLATATINQQRQTQTMYRAQQTQPTTAPPAAGSTNQQNPTQLIYERQQTQPTTAPLAAGSINQQRQTQTIYQAQQRMPMTAPLAVGSINQQRLINVENDQAQQPYYLPRQMEIDDLRQQNLQFQEAPMQPAAPANEQSTKRIICKEMYYKLRNIFPNVDRKYIKKLCPPDWGPGNKDDQMAPIIEHLLAAGETLPQELLMDDIAEQTRNNVSYKSADDLYEFFIGIFPDADPHYLRDFAVKNLGKDDAIKNFVDLNLERREYPTREQYMARLKITEQQRRYTTGFDVKQFLSIIPDPSKHFMDVQRKCKHQTVAFEFLKSHFNKLRVTTISRVYTGNLYNLSIAAQALEILPEELKSKRGGSEMPTEDILLLQEIAFVKHKETIYKYIDNVKKREDEEFRTLKAMNQLLECQCCFDSECVPSKCSECDNGHIFCNSCIITGTSAKMGEDQTRIYCFINCGSEFSLSVLQQVLAPTTFSILLKKRQAAEVIEAGLEGLVSCPFCHFASIPPEGDKIFKCLNPECTKESCRLCKELSHVPLKCDEVTKTENARRYIEERMTQALARKCYKCQRAFFKEEGCNKITCPCGAQMCYLCDQPIKDYTHFRGQGSDNKDLCPLYTDTMRLDAVAVRKVAEEAQREMLQRNPNIHIDTTGLLPDIPLPRNGPHNYVLNADELPRRAQRVLDLPPL